MKKLAEWGDDIDPEIEQKARLKIMKRYAILKMEIDARQKELEELRAQIVEAVTDSEDGKSVTLPFGRFAVNHVSTWKYTSKVADMEAALKKQKKIEQATGEAEVVEQSPRLVFFAK